MKREIKFRVWIPKDEFKANSQGEMNYEPGWNGDLNTCFTSPYLKWMQYAGLKDINGKEIYEGDILKMQESEQYEEGELQEVVFDYDRDFCGWSVEPQYAETGIVIGNIYENPELNSKL